MILINTYEENKIIGHYKDIVDCIQDRVDILVENNYKNDECYPVFKVGILYENENSQKIILNCTHLENTFSRVLFPIKENFYGYDFLGEVIECLYNQTM